MRLKLLAILSSSALAVILLLGIDHINCVIRSCEMDDAAIRASAIFDIPLLFAYIVFSWLIVFPSMLAARRWFGLYFAPLALSLTYSLAFAWLFHMPEIDGLLFQTAQYLVPWLAMPWFIGGLVALAMWPKAEFKSDAEKRYTP